MTWPQAALDDGALDALSLAEAAATGDAEAIGAVLGAWDGRDGIPLIVSLLALIGRLASETGTDITEWAPRLRARMRDDGG